MADDLDLFNDPYADRQTEQIPKVRERPRRPRSDADEPDRPARSGAPRSARRPAARSADDRAGERRRRDRESDGDRSGGRSVAGRPRSRRRMVLWVSLVLVLGLIGAGAWYGYQQIAGIGGYEDFAGPGESQVVVEVRDGDSTGEIANRLVEQGVVASARAFVNAAEGEERVRAVQPGFYVLKTKSSGAEAVAAIVDKKSRVGNLQIKAGTQLDDLIRGGEKEPGIVTLLSEASCAELNGQSTCVPVEELRRVAETADLAVLGVPEWAVPAAAKAEPKRRLEGLVMPNVYDVRPGSTAEELWKAVLTASAVQLQAISMPQLAEETGFTPYEVLVMASLIQREAIAKDFAKVSRVTYNRLAEPMNLEYDSTVNYVLDRPDIRTKKSDRDKVGPYNTYATSGLPPTPIASASKEAIQAAAKPAPGDWLFFVRCEKDGTSCFAQTDAEHERNVDKAQENGAY